MSNISWEMMNIVGNGGNDFLFYDIRTIIDFMYIPWQSNNNSKMIGDLMLSIGQEALISIISHIVCIVFAWRIITSLNIDPIVHKGKVVEARVFFLFIAIVIGSGVSRFLLDILRWSQDLIYLY